MASLKIAHSDYTEVEVITSSSNPRAIKKIHLNHPQANKLIVNEISFLNACNHPNIVKFKKSYFKQKESVHYIEIEALTGGTLGDIDLGENLDLLTKWIKQICSALIYLHERGIIHRDIKLANLMLDSQGNAKIIDFGISAWQWLLTRDSKRVGTTYYMAPEVFLREECSSKIDIYALGVSIYQLIHGKNPFRGQNRKQYWANSLNDQIEFADNCPKEWQYYILRMLDRNVERRPSAKQIYDFLDSEVKPSTLQSRRSKYPRKMIV